MAEPIFVIGYMHSGTTLLLNILSRNSAVFAAGGEKKFFEFLPMIQRIYPNLDDDLILRDFIIFVVYIIQRGYRLSWAGKINLKDIDLSRDHFEALFLVAKQNRHYGPIFRIVFDNLTKMSGKTRWLEKTPTHVFHIDQIVQSIPDAQFVEIVRDPRDVLASKKTRKLTVWTDRYRPEQRPIKHLEKAFDPLWDTLSWKSAIRAGQAGREKYPGRIFSIRYEDLVTDPETRVRQMCDFLKLAFEPQMLAISYRNAAAWDQTKTRQQDGIATDSVGRWRQVLAPPEITLCQVLAGAELDILGYRRALLPLSERAKIPALVGISLFEFVQRLFRRWRLGGFSYFVNVLINYWKRFLKLTHG